MYKAGLIGCGGIAPSHIGGMKETGRAEIVCAWDQDPAALQAACEKWEMAPCESVDDLIARDDLDFIVIATPGFAHLDYVQKAAAAGKHIVCEKPVTLNLEDAEAIKKAVEAAGIVFQVSFNHRHTPEFVKLKRLADEGRVGGLVSAVARLHAPASSARWREIQESGHWRSSAELSGGRINEFCSHTVNWLLWVLGPPKTVYGRALNVTEGFELDDADYALIQCERGTGLLEVNRHAGVAKDSNFSIMGHGGSATLKDGKILLTPMDEETEEVPLGEDFPTKHEEFLDCLESGQQPLNNIDAAIETLRLCLAFNRSAKSNQVEPV